MERVLIANRGVYAGLYIEASDTRWRNRDILKGKRRLSHFVCYDMMDNRKPVNPFLRINIRLRYTNMIFCVLKLLFHHCGLRQQRNTSIGTRFIKMFDTFVRNVIIFIIKYKYEIEIENFVS